MSDNSEAIQEMYKKIDEQLDGEEDLAVRTCGMCGCIFLINQEADEYLWVDRFVPVGNLVGSVYDYPAHVPEHCACHELHHVGN